MLTLQEKFGDKKAMYDILGKFVQSVPSNGGGGGSGGKVGSQPQPANKNVGGGGGGSLVCTWDPARTGGSIQLT